MAPWVLLFIHPKVRPISFQSQPRLSPPARGPGQRPRPGGVREARGGDRDRGRAGAGGHSQGSIQPGRHRQDKDTRAQAGQGQEGRDGEAGRAGTGSGEAERGNRVSVPAFWAEHGVRGWLCERRGRDPSVAAGGRDARIPRAPREQEHALCPPSPALPRCQGVKPTSLGPPGAGGREGPPEGPPGPGAAVAAAPSPRRGAEAGTQKSNFTIAY